MNNKQEIINNIFSDNDKFIEDYNLNIDYSYYAQGMVISKIFETMNNKDKKTFISLMPKKIMKEFEKIGIKSNTIEIIDFKNDLEYKRFMNKCYQKNDYNEEEIIIDEKLKIFADIFKYIHEKLEIIDSYNVSDVIEWLEEFFTQTTVNTALKTLEENNIFLEQESIDSSLLPDLVPMNQGKTKYLTIKDFHELFPEFFKIGPNDTFYSPISLTPDTQGEKVYEYPNSIGRSVFDFKVTSNNEKDEIYTNQHYLHSKNNIKLKFFEIADDMNSYIEKTNFKNEEDEKIFKIFNQNILKFMALKENINDLSKISVSDELSKENATISYSLYQVLFKFATGIGNKIDEYNDVESIFDSITISLWANNLNHENIFRLYDDNSNCTIDLIKEANENMDKLLKKFRNKLRNNNGRTNIPIIKRNDSKINASMKMDEKLLKHVLFTLVNKKALHIYSDPGTGKTSNINAILEILGFKILNVENGVDIETYLSNLVNDNNKIIGNNSLSKSKSIKTRALESGDKIVIFLDEFQRKAASLSPYGLGEALNKFFDDCEKSPNTYVIAASNQDLSKNINIEASLDDRLNSAGLDSKNWEDESFLQGKILDLHLNNYNELFDITSSFLFTNTIKKSYKIRKEAFPNYYRLIEENPKIKKTFDGMKNILTKYDFNSEEYNKSIENMIELFDDKEVEKEIKVNQREITYAINFEFLHDEIKEIEKIKNNINSQDIEPLEKNKLKSIAFSKHNFNKVVNYINDKNFNIDSVKHPSSFEDMINSVYDFLESNPAKQFQKFNVDFEEENSIDASKNKIGFILNEVINNFNVRANVFISKESNIINKLIDIDPSLIKNYQKITSQFKEGIKNFQNLEFLSLRPLSKTLDTIYLYAFNKVRPDLLKLEEFEYKKTKYKSPHLFVYNFDKKISKSEITFQTRNSEIKKTWDSTYILSKVASEMNFYIRSDVQNINDEHEIEDMDSFDEKKESINKYFYRNLLNLLREYYKEANSEEGVDFNSLFDRHIGKIKKYLDEPEEFQNWKTTIMNKIKNITETPSSGMFIPNLEA